MARHDVHTPQPAGVEAFTFAQLVRCLNTPAGVSAAAAKTTWDAWSSRLQVAAALSGQAKGEQVLWAQQAWRAVRALREAGCNTAQLQAALARVPAERTASCAGVVQLFDRYEQARKAAQARDEASPYRRALAQACQINWPMPLAAVREVVVAADVEVVGARLALVAAMAASGRSVTVHLPFSPEQPEAYAWSEALLGGLEALGQDTLEVKFVDGTGQGPLAEVRRRLDAAPDAAPDAAAAPVQVLSCPVGEPLVAHVVHQVHRWVAAGTPPHQIAVVLPNRRPPLWSKELHQRRSVQALQQAGLPVEAAEPARFVFHPAGQLIAQALHLAAALAEGAASAAQAPAPAGAPAATFSATALATLYAALGGPLPPARRSEASLATPAATVAAWLWRLGNRRLPWDGLVHALATLEDVGPERATAACAALQHAVQLHCGPLAVATTLAQSCKLAAALVEQGESRLAGEGEAGLEALALLHEALRTLAVADGHSGCPPRALAEQHRWLLELLQQTGQPRPGQGEQGSQGVALRSPEGCAGSQFARVLVVAANAGIFPRPQALNPWLPEPLLRALVAVGGPRLTPTASVAADAPLPFDARERAQWRQLVAAATDTLQVVLLCDPSGAEEGPSAAVAELLQAAGLAEVGQAILPALAPLSEQPSTGAWLQAACAQKALPASADWGPRVASLQRRLQADAQLRAPRSSAQLHAGVAAELAATWLACEHRATLLDQLGSCRFRYFAEASLALAPLPLPSFTASVRLRGTAMHAGLEVALQALLEAPGGLAAQRADPVAALALAQQAFVAQLPRIVPRASVHPVLYQALTQEVWRAVELRLQADLEDAAAEPLALEWRFGGSAGAAALQVQEPGGGTRTAWVRGSIDRVDLRRATLCTYDYKRSLPQRVAHRHLQLGLYGMVAARDHGPATASMQAAWIALAGSQAGTIKAAGELTGSPEAFGQQVAQNLWSRLGPLLAGEVAPDPESPKVCQRCSYSDLCHFAVNADDADNDNDHELDSEGQDG